MDIYIANNKLHAALQDEDSCRRRYGAEMTKKIMLRLDALQAAASLADFWPPRSGPEQCHELQGDRAGTFSVDLKHPYRLLFEPSTATAPTDFSDAQQRWTSITSINILSIEDTHG